jgi:hypothetical protein
MGFVKDMMMRCDDLGWFPNGDGKYVCKECIEDEALQQIVEENLEYNSCSYCRKKDKNDIAAPLDKITEHIAICISREYTDPGETLPYESREGGYIGDVYTIEEVFGEIEYWVENSNLMEDICSSFSRIDWALRDWMILKPEQRKFSGWKEFKKVVKNMRRYTFWSMKDEFEDEGHPDYMPVGNMLNEIFETIKSSRLIKSIDAGAKFWRVRIYKKDEVLQTDSDFSSPPIDRALQPNRMSPSGIPMFYCAEDFITSCAETIDPDPDRSENKRVTGGCFTNLHKLSILDLTELPIIPSYFDNERYISRYDYIFLSKFARDLSVPIDRDGREHIEYVPTQAFTEYIRWMAETPSGQPINGICYNSSKNGKKCYVLFFTHDECIDNPKYRLKDQCLKFHPDSLHTIDPNLGIKRKGGGFEG